MNKVFLILAPLIILFVALFVNGTKAENNTKPTHIDFILVEKSKRMMSAYHNKKRLKTYRIALGGSPKGHKEEQGDKKTPEGLYSISAKNSNSRYHKSLKISYPNAQDKQHAAKRGYSTGNDIMIHGVHPSFSWLGKMHILRDWTLGCIAVTNEEIDEIFAATPVGTHVEIKP